MRDFSAVYGEYREMIYRFIYRLCRNEELAELQTKQNYEDVLNYFMGMMRFLIRQGTLKNADTGIMAAQFSSPITVWINLCDREPEREDEVMELVRKHVMQFFEIYRK